MNVHLAHESRRAYVFQPYIWLEHHYPWPRGRMREFPPVTPLSAIISGPPVGGPWENGDDSPRAISASWFDIVCPPSRRRLIIVHDVKPAINDADGIDIFNHWKNLLLDAPESCIEIVPDPHIKDDFAQVFDLWLFGNSRVLSLWESFSRSPTSRLVEPSPIVKAAVTRNEYNLLSRGPHPQHNGTSRNPYDRMLAIHIRRGDYKHHCLHLGRWNSTFYSWNLLEQLPDSFVPPPGGKPGKNTRENMATYMEHCLPTSEVIVHKARESRGEFKARSKTGFKTLDTLYLLTNERGVWLENLKTVLKADGWHTIVTTRDLILDREQTEVNMAVDMEIARRAAIFIGNGVCHVPSGFALASFVDQPFSGRRTQAMLFISDWWMARNL